MRQWWLVIALVLSVGINAGWILKSLLTPAQPISSVDEIREFDPKDLRPPREADGRMEFFVERLADDLQLEGEDRQAFIDLQRDFFERVREAHQRSREHRRALRRELLSESPDRARIEGLLEATAQSTAELEKAFVDNILDSRVLLGPEQEVRFLQFASRLRDKREGRHRPFIGGGEGGPPFRRFRERRFGRRSGEQEAPAPEIDERP